MFRKSRVTGLLRVSLALVGCGFLSPMSAWAQDQADPSVILDFESEPYHFTRPQGSLAVERQTLDGDGGWHITGIGGDVYGYYNPPIRLSEAQRSGDGYLLKLRVNPGNVTKRLDVAVVYNLGKDERGEVATATIPLRGIEAGEVVSVPFEIDGLDGPDGFTGFKFKSYGIPAMDVTVLELAAVLDESSPAQEQTGASEMDVEPQ